MKSASVDEHKIKDQWFKQVSDAIKPLGNDPKHI